MKADFKPYSYCFIVVCLRVGQQDNSESYALFHWWEDRIWSKENCLTFKSDREYVLEIL